MANKKRKVPLSMDRLWLLAIEKNVYLKQIADALGIPQDTFRYCCSRGEIMPDYLEQIAKYFGVTTDYLKGR